MRKLAIVLLFLGRLASGETVEIIPILTAPERPVYLHVVLEEIKEASREILVMLSDCRRYVQKSPANSLTDALVEARERGITVRVIIESDGTPRPDTQRAFSFLKENGVEVRWDSPETVLHTKLLIIDRMTVIVGSTPWTYNALFGSYQADLLIRSRSVAEAFLRLFELVWEGKLEAEERVGEVPPPALIPLPELPRGKLLHLETALKLIEEAEEEVLLAMYQFRRYPQYPRSPSNLLVEALLNASARGARVRVILEGGEGSPDPDFARESRDIATYLLLHGIKVAFDPPRDTMHAKLLI
ncbi:TPA: hypothetical protein EYP13_02465, partial [Candidatus Micrarchaeota archaeon]|nr:hypothetical protein [Candidatus Micrarchaeota archaeon]